MLCIALNIIKQNYIKYCKCLLLVTADLLITTLTLLIHKHRALFIKRLRCLAPASAAKLRSIFTMAKPPRSIFSMIYKNFIASFKPRQINGNLMGEDYFGNKYYEIPANPAIGKRKPSRYFTPVDKEDFEQERTAEWDAWLRYRR